MSVKEIEKMTYTDFIAFIQETNRCPGGKRTIRNIAQNTFLTSTKKVLDVGSNTGFNSLEFARLTNCHVSGIDISQTCVAHSNEQLSFEIPEVRENVHFQVASAYDIPFENESFDLTMVSGATSFMEEKNRAVEEYYRVTKPWGYIAVTNLYYRTPPPQTLLVDLREILGVEIKPWTEKDWLNIF